jgi:OOP family OmpA-OmpF porin
MTKRRQISQKSAVQDDCYNLVTPRNPARSCARDFPIAAQVDNKEMESSMNKLALSAAVAALALSPMLTPAAHAQDASAAPGTTATYGSNVDPNWQDNFFAAGNLGQTQARSADLSHNNSVFQNVRFGWRWNGIVGPEIGYVYLGRPKADNGFASLSAKPQAATLGLNAKYNFYQGWFVTAHAGYLRSRTELALTAGDFESRYKTWNNGLYAGLGVGYDVTKNVSLALNYDNYRIQAGNDTSPDYVGVGHTRTNIAAYSASVEYRF